MNQTKKNFLDQFACVTTRAFASHLWDLEAASIADHKVKIGDRILEIVEIYDDISASELKTLGIELLAA